MFGRTLAVHGFRTLAAGAGAAAAAVRGGGGGRWGLRTPLWPMFSRNLAAGI